MRTLVGDTDYQVKPTDTLVVLDEPLTEPRTWTLPQGGVFDGEGLKIVDGRDGVDETNTLTIQAPTGVLLNGVVGGSYVLDATGGLVELVPLSSGSWKVFSVDQNAAQLGGLIVRNLTFNFDTGDIDTGADLVTPAVGEILVGIAGAITQAWDSSVSDALDLGVTGTGDLFVDGQDAQAEAPFTIEAGVLGYVFDGATAVLATIASSGDAPTEGIATLTLITAPATIPEA